MIIGYAILGALLGLPLLLGLGFRVSASHLFFSVMAGELLARYFASTLEFMLAITINNSHVGEYVEPAIIFLPLILTALFLKKSLSRGKAMLHFIPLVITGIVLAAFVLPILPKAVQDQAATNRIGQELLNTSSLIIGGVVLLQLIALWLLNRSRGHRR